MQCLLRGKEAMCKLSSEVLGVVSRQAMRYQAFHVLQDAYKSRLTFSGGKTDSMMVVLLRAIFNGPLETQLVTSIEQAVPVLANWLNFNRIHGRAERTFPLLKSPFKLRLCGKGELDVIQSIHSNLTLKVDVLRN